MRFVFWFLVGIVGLVVWLVYGTRSLCPSCGCELAESTLDHIPEFDTGRMDRCSRCGWRRTR